MENVHINMDQLAQFLKWKIEKEDLSLREAARKAKVSAPTLSRILKRGKKRPQPDVETLVKLIRWVNVPIEKVIEGTTPGRSRRPARRYTPEKIEVHLRADKNLTAEAARAIADMVKVAYEQFTRQRRERA